MHHGMFCAAGTAAPFTNIIITRKETAHKVKLHFHFDQLNSRSDLSLKVIHSPKGENLKHSKYYLLVNTEYHRIEVRDIKPDFHDTSDSFHQ